MEGTKGVPLSSIVKEFKLEVLAQSSQFDQTQIHVTSINRPGLQLMGYSTTLTRSEYSCWARRSTAICAP